MPEVKKTTVEKKKSTGIDWKALGYDAADTSFQSADSIKVDEGPKRFKVVAGKTYRIGFPFVAPKTKEGKVVPGFDVRFKPVEHLKYFDEATKSGAKFVMPQKESLRKQIIDIFTTGPINTHYLTPVVVYDTNDEGKLLSAKEVSYTIKILAIPAGRYSKLKEASAQFALDKYDFQVTLDGDEKTEHFQKMNFKAVTKKDDLNASTATWKKGTLVKLPDDEDDDSIPVTMEDIIAEAYEHSTDMIEALGTRELSDAKIKQILEEWADEVDEGDEGDEGDDEEGIDEGEDVDDDEDEVDEDTGEDEEDDVIDEDEDGEEAVDLETGDEDGE